jgi:hypothetical protein
MGVEMFSWSSYIDLLEKARRDLATLRATRTSLSMDDLFNFVCTSTHVCDWLTKDPRAISAAREAEDLSGGRTGPTMANVVRQLCNGAKHTRPKVGTKVIEDPGALLGAAGLPMRLGATPTTTYEVEMSPGIWRDVVDVCADALEE